MNKNEQDKIEEIINLAREEKLAEEELIKEAIQQKNKYISELEEKNKELHKQLLYLKAEFDNYRKRVEKEKQQKFLLGKVDIIEKIISFYEMFNYAIQSINETELNEDKQITQILNGIKLLHKELETFLLKEGVRKIECINQQFNPNYHEIVEYEEDETKQPDTIVSVISDGYILINNNTEYVIRPAKVKVVKSKQIHETKNSEEASNMNKEET